MNKIPLSRVDGLSVAPLWSAYPEIRAMEKNSNNIFQVLHVILCFHCFSNLLTKIFTENYLNLLLCDGTKIPEFPIDMFSAESQPWMYLMKISCVRKSFGRNFFIRRFFRVVFTPQMCESIIFLTPQFCEIVNILHLFGTRKII